VRMRIVAATLAGAVLAVSCEGTFGMPRGASEQADRIFGLWQWFFVAGAIVAAIVYGLIVWSLIRYRRRRSEPEDAHGAAFRANVPIELVYTGIPIVIVAVLWGISLRADQQVLAPDPAPAVTLEAHAFEWGWRFRYQGEDVEVVSEPAEQDVPGPVIAMPLGQTTHVVLTANQVIHAFWVPDFLFKRDATPGHVQRFDITPTQEGTFHGECAEFCGLNHAYMTFTVVVLAPDEFAAWIDERRGDAA
jgi:cytochrome c oxidase subunit II